MTNAEGKKMTLTESGVYYVRPAGSEFELYMVKDSGNNVFQFK